MPSEFRIESFEPREIKKAQKVLDEHLKEVLDSQSMIEREKKSVLKKGFLSKILAWFK